MNSTKKLIIGIMAMSSLMMALVSIVGIIPLKIEYYSHIDPTMVQMAFTFAILMSIPATLLTGAIALKVGKKPPIVVGVSLILVGGVILASLSLPFTIFVIILSLVGFGVGCLVALNTALIADNFVGEKQSSLMGLQTAYVNIGGVVLSLVGGLLALSFWRNMFWVFLYALPILIIIILFIPNDDKVTPANESSESTAKLTKETYLICLILFLQGIIFGVRTTNVGLILVERNLATEVVALANYSTSAMTGMGIVIGFLYGKIVKATGEPLLPLAYFLLALGFLLIGNAPNLFVFFLGNVLTGVGFPIAMPTILGLTARSVLGSATLAISVVMSFNALAIFVSPMVVNYLTEWIGFGSVQARFNMGAILLLALCGITGVYRRRAISKSPNKSTY